MSWTDERVEILKKLWMEGLSASQIAGELGEGVTRNAVIGKVHRLKLSARAKPATSASRPRTATRTAPRRPSSGTSSTMGGGASLKRRVVQSAPTLGATALKPSEDVNAEVELQQAQIHEMFIPEGERLSLLALNENTCKWPIGDPLNADFHFCGRQSEENKPYCDFHSKRAYHQIERKRR